MFGLDLSGKLAQNVPLRTPRPNGRLPGPEVRAYRHVRRRVLCCGGAPAPASCADNRYVRGVGCERPEITDIAGENRPAQLCKGDDEGVDGRSPLRGGAQDAGSASKLLGDLFNDVAGLQEPVRDSVVLRAAAEALDKDHGRHHGRPDTLAHEDGNERSSVLASSGEARYASGVQYQSAHDARLASRGRRTFSATASALAIAASLGVPTSATSSST
jgi:hypothetical protein